MSTDEILMIDRAAFAEVFTHALMGHDCAAFATDGSSVALPVNRWLAGADHTDEEFLAHCRGATIDIGCGPGRLAERLAERGLPSLGIDLVDEAVRRARARGATARRLDVFQPVPAEGRWSTAVLADGNIGIGGDPLRLLARIREILAPGGRLVVEVGAPGTGTTTDSLVLACAGLRTAPFPWSIVGADAIASLAQEAGFSVAEPAHAHGDRWCAVLAVTP